MKLPWSAASCSWPSSACCACSAAPDWKKRRSPTCNFMNPSPHTPGHARKVPWGAFWRLVLIQAQNSFNEKGAQFLLIPLGVWLYGTQGDLEYPLGAIIVLPFILFSPFVGWLSDRFCKARIIQSMALLQICVLAGMYWSLRTHNLDGAILWFCVFAVQATIFSPSKKGIVKDIVGTSRMGFASGIVEMASILSLLIGQIGVFVWFRYLLEPSTDTVWHHWLGEGFFQWFDAWLKPSGLNDGWYAASFPCLVFLLMAVPVAISSFYLPRYAPEGFRPFSWSLFYEHFHQLGKLWKNRNLRVSEMGIGYFWFFGGTIMLMTIQMAKEISGGSDDFSSVGAVLMAWMSGGTVLGGILASLICRRHIRMNVSVAGGALMALSCVALSTVSMTSTVFYALLMAAGISAALFLVPLNAFFQDRADNDKRGDMIAAGNLVDCVLGLMAVGFQYAMMLVIPPSWQFVVMGILSLGMAWVIFRFSRVAPGAR
ncbi:hypothetical protein CXU13_00260 [Akkermansia muciniphila]|uniref:MFS transporter n=4 Tax=Akkermansia TaxID=239934 RepID=A0AAE6TA02_9BACT|nr:hypothetical protein CXU18_05070 [Akkermansia muciniphila]QHV62911.1 MFS transporter [Akkermansia massiliensis]HCL34490.1 MFS transporter [Akkermansia sp.]PNC35115.1 hypothetical protein CXU12_03905 [Akkermansia muciniphila]PNC48048.1 hypothetical protein CXU11_09915 [Akkermansia muciniphila]